MNPDLPDHWRTLYSLGHTPVTWFGRWGATHAACLGKKQAGEAHPSPGLQLVSFKTGCHTKMKEPGLHYSLLIAGGGIIKCMPLLRKLALQEMQRALFGI